MNYQEQLRSEAWQNRRKSILHRDHNRCAKCNNMVILQHEGVLTGRAINHENDWGIDIIVTVLSRDLLIRASISDEIKATLPKMVKVYYYMDAEIQSNKPKIAAILDESGEFIHVPGLHVHHQYYQFGKMAWDYPEEALITLCWICHENTHKSASIPILDDKGRNIGKLTPCIRCYSAGYFPEFRHVNSGICFRCKGARYEEFI